MASRLNRLRLLAVRFMAAAPLLSVLCIKAQRTTVDPEVKLADARQHTNLGQWPEAERELREIVALDPAAADAEFLLGSVLLHERRPTESLAAYNTGAHLRLPTAEEWIAVASDYILLKDLADAEKWLQYAAANEPSNVDVLYLLGRTQYNENHDEDAAHSFTRCLELRPRDARAEYNLGLAYEKLQQTADAVGAYQTAISWQSGQPKPDPQPYLDLGNLLFRQGKPAEALDPLQQAVRFGSGNAFANQQLGLVFEALGRSDEAVASFQRASSLAPEAEQPHYFLGRLFHRLGRTSEAAAEFAVVSKLLGTHSARETPNIDDPR